MNYSIGIDLGGTNIAGGVVGQDGTLYNTRSIRTGAPCTPQILADRIAGLCHDLAASAGLSLQQVSWVGLGVPGSVEKSTGILDYANNLNFRRVPLCAMLKERLQLPVFMENDANAAAWGEYCTGPHCESLVMVTLGTGVGGGIVENGRILSGCNGAAGELGHFVIDLNGKPCNCGLRGCFEQYASVSALVEQTRAKMDAAPDSLLWAECKGKKENVDGRTAFDAMRRGDMAACEVVRQYIHYLCVGLTGIINIFQPERLCLGGGISREGEVLLNPVRAFTEKYGYGRDSIHQTQITTARLGPEAGIVGAALLGCEQSQIGKL